MYSGTTLRHGSGNLAGVHQRIDKFARRCAVSALPSNTKFPALKQILRFEGKNGPDGIKRKSPSQDEPWHYIDPNNPDDRALLDMINDHSANLTEALRSNNETRAAFEAAWLAHAIVDGLTPAHHYPLAEKIEELFGMSNEERDSFRKKTVIRGENRLDTLAKNWAYWGTSGTFTDHYQFEWGVVTATALSPMREFKLSEKLRQHVVDDGIEKVFLEALHDINELHMYDEFHRRGWTRHLAFQSRRILIPRIVETVALAWYGAAEEAKK
jgi:hypothetical protein